MKIHFKRYYQPISDYLKENQVLLIYGPRRVGKTTLIRDYLASTSLSYKLSSGDNYSIQKLFSSRQFDQLLEFAHGYELIVIDEAQKIPFIGEGLKILVDEIPGIKVIATGSSSFELANQVGEPLTGRKKTLQLFPFSQGELLQRYNEYELKELLEQFLIYGAYPEVVIAGNRDEKRDYLIELVDSYIFKDILALERIKGSDILNRLLQLLAFQVGQLVSFNELSNTLGIDVKTVERYIDLLEKSFIIFHISSLNRNLRNEISKKKKYYFYDNGIRNCIISQFNRLDLRQDVGALWENFIVSERLKFLTYKRDYANLYFWRTYAGQEIDWIEERDALFYPYEMKFSDKKITSLPKLFTDSYASSELNIVNRANYLGFLK
jgi:predicted AAA+ superfamily ATPase